MVTTHRTEFTMTFIHSLPVTEFSNGITDEKRPQNKLLNFQYIVPIPFYEMRCIGLKTDPQISYNPTIYKHHTILGWIKLL